MILRNRQHTSNCTVSERIVRCGTAIVTADGCVWDLSDQIKVPHARTARAGRFLSDVLSLTLNAPRMHGSVLWEISSDHALAGHQRGRALTCVGARVSPVIALPKLSDAGEVSVESIGSDASDPAGLQPRTMFTSVTVITSLESFHLERGQQLTLSS